MWKNNYKHEKACLSVSKINFTYSQLYLSASQTIKKNCCCGVLRHSYIAHDDKKNN